MTRSEQLIALRKNVSGTRIDDRTRCQVLDYLEQNKTAAEITQLTGVAGVTVYKWKKMIRDANEKRMGREATS